LKIAQNTFTYIPFNAFIYTSSNLTPPGLAGSLDGTACCSLSTRIAATRSTTSTAYFQEWLTFLLLVALKPSGNAFNNFDARSGGKYPATGQLS
jgi:hypothetical protein